MNRLLAMTAILLGILCSVPNSYASDSLNNGSIIGTVAMVLPDGLLLRNVCLKVPSASLKPGDSYYEYEMSRYIKTNETIFIYTDSQEFKANDLVAGSIRFKDMHSSDKGKHEAAVSSGAKTKDKPSDGGDKVRAFRVFGILDRLDSDKDIEGPRIMAGAAPVQK